VSARRCGWCGRDTDDYIIYEIETDHGTDPVVWCTDATGCSAARKRPPQVNYMIKHAEPRDLRRAP
jgi:hypothetical protein